jgi:predicted transposase YbfD/YdcC
MECNTTEFVFDAGSLYHHFCTMSDVRKKRGIRYSLPIILLLIILAKLCGQDTPYGIADWAKHRDEWLCEALSLNYACLPHHSTYRRILALYGSELEGVIELFLAQLVEKKTYRLITLDGKTSRGTITSDDPFGLHLLTAYFPEIGIALKHLPVEKEKENEIVVAPKLLESLNLEDKIVLGDAMQTQKALSSQIVRSSGDFVWIVKDNQRHVRQAIEFLFAPERTKPGQGWPCMDFRTAKTVDKQHGRLEERTITVSCMLNDYLNWPAVQQVFKIERLFTYSSTGKRHQETQYGITSLTLDEAGPERMLEIIRSEWSIENGLHYRRDVTFHEDKTRMTSKTIAHAMASINNLVIALLHHHGFTNHAQARRLFDAKPAAALALTCQL